MTRRGECGDCKGGSSGFLASWRQSLAIKYSLVSRISYTNHHAEVSIIYDKCEGTWLLICDIIVERRQLVLNNFQQSLPCEVVVQYVKSIKQTNLLKSVIFVPESYIETFTKPPSPTGATLYLVLTSAYYLSLDLSSALLPLLFFAASR